jgi:hypothetical protein
MAVASGAEPSWASRLLIKNWSMVGGGDVVMVVVGVEGERFGWRPDGDGPLIMAQSLISMETLECIS